MSLPPDIITLELEGVAPSPLRSTIGFDDAGGKLSMPVVRRRLGRFTVLGVLGRGAMGTVLEAYDDTLARNVALKLLHGRVNDERKDRVLREAQALAQLSHPNVVQVYEVGLVEDQMFIAMELVGGQTLRKWQRQRRSWREVVSAYLQAGRGLAAAHARGLVHRDFKPENCIISEDGRVRVLDFGLARGGRIEEPTGPVTPLPEHSALQLRMTQSGRVMGTLSYLPLSQLLGRPADAKSDQFSFCASVWEALYGVLPYDDRTLPVLIAAHREQRLQPLPRGRRVPRRLHRALLRGLARRSDERWPSMEALLVELERLVTPRRWPLTATLVAGFGLGALVVVATDRDEAAPCDDGRAALEGTWGPTEREAVRAAYRASGHAQADRLLVRVETELDAYADAWVRVHEQSCRAAFVTHERNEAAFERTERCLQRHRGRLRAVIDALGGVSSASEALERTALPFKLPVVDGCATLETVGPSLALPGEPDQRQRVLALRSQVDRANTLAEAGANASALDVALAAVEDARAMGSAPALAEALETLGRLQATEGNPGAEATLRDAIEAAARAKDDTMAARAWSSIVYAIMRQDELDRGLSLRFAATAAVERADDPVARGWLLNNLGTLYGQRGDHEEARVLLEQALEVKRKSLGLRHLDTGIAWFNLGLALKDARRLDEARQALEHAREIVMGTVGESHLYMASVETGLGHVLQVQGDREAAVEHHARALAIREQALGPDHVQVARSHEYLGKTRLWQHELDEAAKHLGRALEIYEQELGPRSAQVGTAKVWLAEAELQRGHKERARGLAEQALGVLESLGRLDERARARFVMARVLGEQPAERERARGLAEQARTGFEGRERAEVEAWLATLPSEGSGGPGGP